MSLLTKSLIKIHTLYQMVFPKRNWLFVETYFISTEWYISIFVPFWKFSDQSRVIVSPRKCPLLISFVVIIFRLPVASALQNMKVPTDFHTDYLSRLSVWKWHKHDMLTQTLLEDTAANCSNAHEGNAWLYIHAGNWNKSRAFQGLAWFRVSCIPL